MVSSSSERAAAPTGSSRSSTEPKVKTGPSMLWPLLLILPWAFFIAAGD